MLREKEKEEINKMIESMFHKLDSKEIDYIVNLSNYYEEYKNKYNIMKENANILAKRIDKAIKHIKQHCIDDEFYINLSNKEKGIVDVLNILQGSDK